LLLSHIERVRAQPVAATPPPPAAVTTVRLQDVAPEAAAKKSFFTRLRGLFGL
jgi:hypothetical protein